MRNQIIKQSDTLERLVKQAVEERLSSVRTEVPREDTRQYYTRQETAQLLSVTLPTLYRWDKEGKLKAKRISGRVYYLDEDIRKAMQ